MSDATVLDTPEQINMWVLLSRRGQIKMHERFAVKGLLTCLKREFGNHGNRVRNYIVPVEFAISEAGGKVDYTRVNLHVMLSRGGVFYDQGIYNSPDDVPENLRVLFGAGGGEAVLTLDEPREATQQMFVPA